MGPVSGTERSTRGTGVVTSFILHTGSNLTDRGRARRVLKPLLEGLGNFGKVYRCWTGGHGEGLRRTRGDAAGTQSGSSFVERMTVNTGTAFGLPLVLVSCGVPEAGCTDHRAAGGGAESPLYSEPGKA